MPPSPFAPSSSKPGHGEVHITLLPPATPTYSTLTYTYPLKLVPSTPHKLTSIDDETPQTPKRPVNVPLLFLLSYGGGLLPPDNLSLDITLHPSTRLCITTQGSTKIFPVPDAFTTSTPPVHASQSLTARLHPHSALLLSPDPTQPFKGSRYIQKQIFQVHAGASLGVVDWVSQGRRARGENWDNIIGYRSGNEVWRVSLAVGKEMEERRLILRDNIILEGKSFSAKMDNVGIFGTVLLHGPLFSALAEFFLEEFRLLPRIGGRSWEDENADAQPLSDEAMRRKERWRLEREEEALWTAARLRGGVVLVKFGAREVEGGRKWLGAMLREEGSVAREFGEGGLMNIR
ncbi:MAG: hypothetical protein MMC33_007232 [Icmadophila ericetorum]|nr:hypothetical protein [Icmadophila ericetorum]